MNFKLDDATCYRLLKILEEQPNISQRKLAEEMGVSLGKANYCLKAMINVGFVKMRDFVKSNSKIGYAYLLTPKGVSEKSNVTRRFLSRKIEEYKLLKKEIEVLKLEVRGDKGASRNVY